MEKWIWIELIGFDKDLPDFAIDDLFYRIGYVPDGVSILISSADFVNAHGPGFENRELSPMCCSYEGHPCNEERKRQVWYGKDLIALIRALQSRKTQVFLSFFNMFTYRNDAGETVMEPFCAAHRELWEQRRNGELQPTLHMLKHLSDGTPYSEFLSEKLVEVLTQYGFDGVQLADGISSARLTVQNGDYSDDMVRQFCEDGGDLPENVLHAEYTVRADYIYKNLLEEWLQFLSRKWAAFYKTVLPLVKRAGKKVIFNSCWTREPFEAFYRYGLDYRKLDLKDADACMVEEVSACMSVYGNADQGGFRNSLEDRALWHYEFWAMQLLMKKVFPDLALYNLSSLKDTNEQWDVVRDSPTEYSKAVYRDAALAIWKGNQFIPTLSGAFYCLADGISCEVWKKIGDIWSSAEMQSGFEPQGFLSVSAQNGLDEELHMFLQTRFYPSHKILSELLRRGAPIAGVAEPEDALSYPGGLLLVYPEYFSEKARNELLARKDVPVFVITTVEPKNEEYHCIARHTNGGLTTWFAGYNLNKARGNDTFIVEKRTAEKKFEQEREGGIWTKKLNFEKYNGRFFTFAVKKMLAESGLPVITRENDLSVAYTVRTSDKKYRLYVDNRAYYYALPVVDCKQKISKVRSLTKYAGFTIPQNGTKIRLRIPSRGIEVAEFEILNDPGEV